MWLDFMAILRCSWRTRPVLSREEGWGQNKRPRPENKSQCQWGRMRKPKEKLPQHTLFCQVSGGKITALVLMIQLLLLGADWYGVFHIWYCYTVFLFVNIFENLKNVHSLRCLRWPVQNNVNKINEKLVVHFLNKHKFCKHLQTSQQFVSASWTQALNNVDYVKMPKSRPKRPACLWFLQPDRDVNSGWVV